MEDRLACGPVSPVKRFAQGGEVRGRGAPSPPCAAEASPQAHDRRHTFSVLVTAPPTPGWQPTRKTVSSSPLRTQSAAAPSEAVRTCAPRAPGGRSKGGRVRRGYCPPTARASRARGLPAPAGGGHLGHGRRVTPVVVGEALGRRARVRREADDLAAGHHTVSRQGTHVHIEPFAASRRRGFTGRTDARGGDHEHALGNERNVRQRDMEDEKRCCWSKCTAPGGEPPAHGGRTPAGRPPSSRAPRRVARSLAEKRWRTRDAVKLTDPGQHGLALLEWRVEGEWVVE